MKLTLIILASTAVVLGLIALFVVFYGGGTYAIVANNQGTFSTSTAGSSTLLILPTPSSTASSSASSTGGAGGTTSGTQVFTTDYASPIVTWTDAGESMAVTGASFDGVSELTLRLQVAMGSSTACVPMDLRLLTDEEGDLAAPLTSQFTFPESGTCEGAPGATYSDQPVIFNVASETFPLFVSTGGSSSFFFEVATTSYGGVNVSLPQTQG